MKIKIKEKNDSVILLNLKLAWDYIESDYIDVENKALSKNTKRVMFKSTFFYNIINYKSLKTGEIVIKFLLVMFFCWRSMHNGIGHSKTSR